MSAKIQAPPADQVNTAEELQKIEYEPLLPVEIKLIQWSLALGVILLLVLIWVSYTFFTVK